MSETEQAAFWRGQFGDDYARRNPLDAAALRNRVAMWARILAPLAGSPPANSWGSCAWTQVVKAEREAR